jgi:hypothetical protein
MDKTLIYIQMLTLQSVRMAALKTAEGNGVSSIANSFVKFSDALSHEIGELKEKIAEIEKGEKK